MSNGFGFSGANNPIVAATSTSIGAIVYILESVPTEDLIWTSTAGVGVTSVTPSGITSRNQAQTFTYTLESGVTSGTFTVTVKNGSGTTIAEGKVYLVPPGWTDDNLNLFDGADGITYATQVQGGAPTDFVNLVDDDGWTPDVIIAAREAANGAPETDQDPIGISIACYVLLLNNYPEIGTTTTPGVVAGPAPMIDARKLKKP